jgi:CRAL/TRIO domain
MAPRPTVVGSSTTSYAFDDDDDNFDQGGGEDDIMALNMSIMHIDPKNTKLHTAADDLGFYQTEEEQTGVGEVLFSLTKEEVESFPDEQMPLRHYRAEKGNLEKAIAKLKATIQWRAEFGVLDIIHCLGNTNGSTTATTSTTSSNATATATATAAQVKQDNTNEQEVAQQHLERKETASSNIERYKKEELASVIRKENDSGKMYVRGYDKDGRALLYMRPAKENTKGDEMNNLRHLVFNLEKAIACSFKKQNQQQQNQQQQNQTHNPPDYKICLVIDYEGFQLRQHSPPMSTSRKTLEILQHHYPERMHRVYLCNPPLMFRTFWAMIRPFVDPVTKEKICFCHGDKGMALIVKDVVVGGGGGGDDGPGIQLEPCAGGPTTPPVRPFSSKEYLALPWNVTFDEK